MTQQEMETMRGWFQCTGRGSSALCCTPPPPSSQSAQPGHALHQPGSMHDLSWETLVTSALRRVTSAMRHARHDPGTKTPGVEA
jgi:hypothetical protein